MSLSVTTQSNHLPVEGPTPQQIDAFVHKMLTSESTGPNATEFRTVDKLNISAQAKKSLEDAMARQELTLAEGAQQQSQQTTPAQRHFVYNGSVYNAIMSYASGEGSLLNITDALAARGQRIDDVLSHPTPAPSPAAPDATASTPGATPTT